MSLLQNVAQLTAMSRENIRGAGGGQPMVINNIDNSQKSAAIQNKHTAFNVPTSPHNGQSTKLILDQAYAMG